MERIRRAAPLTLSLLLVLVVAGLGFAATRAASNRAQAVHVADRVQEQTTLAGLGTEYVLFGFKEEVNFATSHTWSLSPDDLTDVAQLRAYAGQSALLSYGAALVDLASGTYLSTAAPTTGLPPMSDPAMAPLLASLRHGSPGLSSVIHVGSVPLVAYGVTLTTNGTTVGFLGFSELTQSPLETYVMHLHFGRTGVAYVLDSHGVAVAASDPALVGRRLVSIPPLAALNKGKGGFDEYRSATGEQIATFDPIGIGGWGGLTTESASEFFGPIRSDILRVEATGALLLVVAAGMMAVFVYRRQAALRREMHTMNELVEARERFRHAFEETPVGMALIGVQAGSRGTFLQVNQALCQLTGFSVGELLERRITDLVHPDNTQQVRTSAERLFSGDLNFELEIRLATSAGAWKWVVLHGSLIRDTWGRPLYGVTHLDDITERKTLEEELRHQALHDSLTGLANRALFMDRVEHALARQGRAGGALAVLLVDLDDFKSINDSLGHEMGDRLLAEVAVKLGGAVRDSDTVARLGGDEFALLLEDLSQDDAVEEVAEQIVKSFAKPIVVDGRTFLISASVGVEISTSKTSGADELLRNADMAMYSAKNGGKGRFARFDPPMHAAVQKRLELKTDLLKAVHDGDQMELYYQPIVHLMSRQVTSVEALVRWNHPRYGLIEPAEFLSVSEESGLIIELGRWVLSQAVNQLASWRTAHQCLASLAMNVNVSGRQLEDSQFTLDLRDTLEQSGIDPSLLVLEITESVLMHDTKDTIARLLNLKRQGVRLAIDDFGTGYSSLGYLQHFPIDILKVDRSFTSDIGDSSRQSALAEAVVGMGPILGLQTVAEGVELEEQALRLASLGCVYGQGFLFSTPLPAFKCEDLICEMAELHGSRGRDHSQEQLVDLRFDACRGTLVFHKDSSVECSERTCVTSRKPQRALGNHSFVVMCQQARCVYCANANDAIRKGLDVGSRSVKVR